MALPKEMTEGGDLTEFWLNQQKLEEQRKFLGLPSYEEQMKRQAEGQTPVTPLEAFSAIARPIESVTGAPTRAAAKAMSEGKGFGSAFTAFKEQFGKNPETAPTGEELASSVVPYGASPKLLGLGLDVTLDPSNLLGPGLAAGAAIGGLKRLRTAAEIATDIERLAPQNPLGFYSKLERALVEALPPTGTVSPGQVKNIAATQKAEEVAQTGLIPWLESKQTFTRDDLLEYLAQNRLDLSEITSRVSGHPLQQKLEAASAELRQAEIEYDSALNNALFEARDKQPINETLALLKQVNDSDPKRAAAAEEALKAAKIDISNYKQASKRVSEARQPVEYLSARVEELPEKYRSGSYPRFEQHKKHLPGGSEYQETQFIFNPKDNPAGLARRQAVFDKYQPELDRLRKEINSLDYATRVAAHKKYDELVYKRYKEADEAYPLVADQERFLTSHWPMSQNVISHARTQKFKNTEGETVFLVDELQSDWHQKGRKIGYKSEGSTVPDAPLKKNWPEMVMKRMIRQAIDSGADGLAWTPGRIQAQRYGLSNYVSRIELRHDPLFSDQKELVAFDKEGRKVLDKLVPDAEVQDYIGKELSDKLSKSPLEKYQTETIRGETETRHRQALGGLDLEVGGEGMKAFYDKMLPDFMRSYVKKYGGKLETTEIVSDGKKITVPYVRFTPEMKKKITTEGQPLYQVAAPITAGALLKEYIEQNRKQAE